MTAGQHSADGRWRWDGNRWVAVPAGGQVEGPYQLVAYAGFWIRFLAWLIDSVLTFVASLVVAFILGIFFGILEAIAGTNTSAATALALISNLFIRGLLLALEWLYYSLLQSSRYQASLGMLAVGLSVVGYDGHGIGFGRATGRYFASWLSGLILGIGYLLIAFTERKQALHDLIATTLVVRARPVPGVRLVGGGRPVALTSGQQVAAAVAASLGAVAILFLTSIVVIVILLTMGHQIQNVFSNVVVALGTG